MYLDSRGSLPKGTARAGLEGGAGPAAAGAGLGLDFVDNNLFSRPAIVLFSLLALMLFSDKSDRT